ncbi:hypothetical protein RclHR1_27460001 [Rhizophagus clarus]|uniref:Uncharacterized protein n=1 Tax=Rhizophagus clarus TaxID=94130 RepID=A0A2Z6R6B4_9GLOM|nr:hypothetical protein RclHR1_27460001 [Rhizophagus clarus]GES99950.1 hypothetical protein RCL_e12086_RclHR1_27460001 [Rhizophagus clarus]
MRAAVCSSVHSTWSVEVQREEVGLDKDSALSVQCQNEVKGLREVDDNIFVLFEDIIRIFEIWQCYI